MKFSNLSELLMQGYMNETEQTAESIARLPESSDDLAMAAYVFAFLGRYNDARYCLSLIQERSQSIDKLVYLEFCLTYYQGKSKTDTNILKDLQSASDPCRLYCNYYFYSQQSRYQECVGYLARFADSISSISDVLALSLDFAERVKDREVLRLVENAITTVAHEERIEKEPYGFYSLPLRQPRSPLQYDTECYHESPLHQVLNVFETASIAPNESLIKIRKLVDSQPNFYLAHYVHGRILSMLGRYENAADSFLDCVKLMPIYQQAYTCAGEAFFVLDMTEQSMCYFKKALALDPLDEHASIRLRSIYKSKYDMRSMWKNEKSFVIHRRQAAVAAKIFMEQAWASIERRILV